MYGERSFEGDRGNHGRFNDRSHDRQMTPPVKEGEELDVTIEAVGEKGDGIAKQKGFVLFIPGAKAGERVHIKITRVLAKVGFGQVLGPATTPAEAEQRPQKAPEPEFKPNEELDSENFGDDMADDADDHDDEEES